MSEERSVLMYEAWRESTQRFDHLVTGLTAALVAYVANTFSPQRISVSPNTLELLALIIFALSVWAGFRRIAWTGQNFRYNFVLLHSREKLDVMATILRSGKEIVAPGETEPMPPDEVGKEAEKTRSTIARFEKLIDGAQRKSLEWGKRRDLLLVIGFGLLIGSRIWSPYFCP